MYYECSRLAAIFDSAAPLTTPSSLPLAPEAFYGCSRVRENQRSGGIPMREKGICGTLFVGLPKDVCSPVEGRGGEQRLFVSRRDSDARFGGMRNSNERAIRDNGWINYTRKV